MNKKKQQPWVWFSLDALFPYGFRKMQEEHPLVWVMAHNLEKDDRRIFQEHLTNRLRSKGGDWINEDCGRDYPGHYISTHDCRSPKDRPHVCGAISGDSERSAKGILDAHPIGFRTRNV